MRAQGFADVPKAAATAADLRRGALRFTYGLVAFWTCMPDLLATWSRIHRELYFWEARKYSNREKLERFARVEPSSQLLVFPIAVVWASHKFELSPFQLARASSSAAGGRGRPHLPAAQMISP